MKPNVCTITNPDIARYAEEHTSPESAQLYQLNRWAHLNMAQPRMIAGAYQGQLLQMFIHMIRPKRVLELGSYIGYSTVCLAQSMPDDAILHAVEVEEEYQSKILKNIADAGVDHKVRLHIGEALTVVPTLEERFDLAFVDADKINTLEYYKMLVPRMAPGGFIIVDNILWSGKVILPQPEGDRETKIIREFNDYVQNDPRVENILLPLRDGLMVARVKE